MLSPSIMNESDSCFVIISTLFQRRKTDPRIMLQLKVEKNEISFNFFYQKQNEHPQNVNLNF